MAEAKRFQNAPVYLAEFAQEPLPRYTSYPPANRFTDAIGESDLDAAFRSLPHQASLSFYAHIPYCRALCWYCGCHTAVPTRADPVGSYLEALVSEFRQAAARIPASATVRALHLGGGSPDILTPDQISGIFAGLRAGFRFAPDAEIAAELDPRGVTQEIVAALAEQGLSRASLGVQTVRRDVQLRINRLQPPEIVSAAVQRLRKAGVPRLNIDIMYGLPGQTVEDVVATAKFAADLGADRIAAFGYAHVPWFKKHQKSIAIADLPDGEERFRQAMAASEALASRGYQQIGFDHFARPDDAMSAAVTKGELRRNFQGYTTDTADALIGFGSSAISSLPMLYAQNTPDARLYRQRLAEGRLATARGVRLAAADREVGDCISELLCHFRAEAPAGMTLDGWDRLARLERAGLCRIDGRHVHITAAGRPYARNVAAAFDPGIAPTAGRHSLAI